MPPPTNGAMSAGLLGFVGAENSWRPLNHFLHENMVVLHLRHHGGVGEIAVQLVARAAAQQPLDTRVHPVLQLAQVVRWREEGLRQLRHYQKK